MGLTETLSQLPDDYEVILKPKGGSVTYTDTAARWLADNGRAHRLEDFELAQPIIPPSPDSGTLAQLMGEELEPIRFVINGLVPEGLTILAGKPKLGKSWLALSMSLAICANRPALNHSTTQGEILYIALEDGKRRMQDRVRILGGDQLPGDDLARFHYRTEWATLDHGGLQALEQWIVDHPDTRLIVVDTWQKIRGDAPGKDRYAEEYKTLGQLQSLAINHRIALILIHHLRKQAADDWLEQLSGSQAVTGAADTLLGLFRDRGQMDATLRLVSREIEEKDLALKFDDGRWESMGDAANYRTTVERSEILEALESLGGEGSAAEISPIINKHATNVSKLLQGLLRDGLIVKVRHGFYSLTHPVESVDSSISNQPLLPNQPLDIKGEESSRTSHPPETLPEPW